MTQPNDEYPMDSGSLTKTYIDILPDCSFHQEMGVKRLALFDGRIKGRRSWAYMCDTCFEAHGVGLGLGRGQRLEVRDD